jgi:TatD DNase family protein
VSKKKKEPLPVLADNTYLVDSHCHLDMDSYSSDCREVVERAGRAGVKYVMTIGIDLQSSQAAVRIAEHFPNVYCSIGVHPHHCAETSPGDYEALVELAGHPKVKAYGEIGLDYVKNYAPIETQLDHFKRQVVWAKKLNLPLVVHDREAHGDVMRILSDAAPFPAGGVMHCYSGDRHLAKEVLGLGFYLSIPGVVTFNRATDIQETVAAIPLASLLVETDGPYLSPEPYRGRRNEPAYVIYTARKIAEIKGVGLDDVARQTSRNACRLFGLKG